MEKEVDMRRKRATDMRGNRNVFMPGPSKPQVEAEQSTRIGVWEKEFWKFMQNECREDGSQKTNNLSRSQSLGLKSLIKESL